MFKIGDKVKVVNIDKSHHMYVHELDKYLGCVITVQGRQYGCDDFVACDCGQGGCLDVWYVPLSWLQLVESVVELKNPLVISSKTVYTYDGEDFDSEEEANIVYLEHNIRPLIFHGAYFSIKDVIENRDALIKMLEDSKQYL